MALVLRLEAVVGNERDTKTSGTRYHPPATGRASRAAARKSGILEAWRKQRDPVSSRRRAKIAPGKPHSAPLP
jgi:hypothetical protein